METGTGTATGTVEIVCVGDELLNGDVVNSNASVLGDLLTVAGLQVTTVTTVGDTLDLLTAALRTAVARADAVVVTGGLGPTSDDRTREALAALTGVPLLRDPDVERELRQDYVRMSRRLTETGLRQADVPQGARVLPNTTGTAPGLAVDAAGTPVFAVPGVPHEMAAMVAGAVLPDLLARAGSPAPRAQRILRTAGVGEGVVAQYLAPLEAELAGAGQVDVAYLAVPGETRVKLTSSGPGGGDAVDAAAARARELLGDCVYAEGRTTLAETVVALLQDRGESVAVAESLTGGLVAAALTDVAGVSAVLRGSVTAYATDLKHAVLGVDAALLAAHGAVHPDVAHGMALGAARVLGASWAIATTGVAGPDPQDGQPAGTVHVAVAGPDGTVTVASPLLAGDRARIRAMTVVRALDLLRRALLGLPAEQARECTG